MPAADRGCQDRERPPSAELCGSRMRSSAPVHRRRTPCALGRAGPRLQPGPRLTGPPCAQNPMQKDWQHYKLNKNGNPVVYKMHVKIGDTVKVIRGTDKGKVGSVKEVRPLSQAMRLAPDLVSA